MKLQVILAVMVIIVVFVSCNESGDKEKITATGTIEAKYVTLSSKTPGEIKKINFEEGSVVKAGDTLLILDNENLRLQLNVAEAGVELARAQYELLINGSRKEDIEQAEAVYAQALANFHQAENDKNRFESLLKSQSVTQKQYDDIVLRYVLSKEQLQAAEQNLKKMKNIARPEELKQAKARLDQAIANAELIRKSIRDTYIISPMDGTVSKQYVEQGETVGQMASLLKVSNLQEAEITVYIPEEELPYIKVGDKADIFLDAGGNTAAKGEVIFISPEAEFTPKNILTKDERVKLVFAVRLRIPNEKQLLKPGLPADVQFLLTKNQ